MYETLFIPKKYTSYTLEDVEQELKRFAQSKDISLDKKNNGFRYSKGNNYLDFVYAEGESVLIEAQEIAQRFGISTEQTNHRFEMFGKDDDDVLYNSYLGIFESLRDTYLFYILDAFTGDLLGKDIPLNKVNRLADFIERNAFISNLDKEIANIQTRKFNLPKNNYSLEPRFLSAYVAQVEYVGVNTLDKLVELLHTKHDEILAMTERFVVINETIYLGTCLKYLSYELIAASQDKEKIETFASEHSGLATYKKLAQTLYGVYAKKNKK